MKLSPSILKSLEHELGVARKHYPVNAQPLNVLDKAVAELKLRLAEYKLARTDNKPALKNFGLAATVYVAGIKVAVMAIRIIEEGDPQHPYGEARRDAKSFNPLGGG